MPKVPDRKHATAWMCCAMVCAARLALADAAESCESPVLTLRETASLLRIPTDELEHLAEQREIPGRRIGNTWRFNCSFLMEWLNGDQRPVDGTDAPDFRQSLKSEEMSSITGGGAVAAQDAPTPSNADRGGTDFEQDRIGEAPDERTAEDVLLRDQRVLVSPRRVSLNFGQFYSKNDSLVFASADEGNVLAALEQAALLTSFQARFGISNKTEMFVSTSYVSQDSDLFLGSQRLASSGNSEFGKVLLGARRTLSREGVGRPSIIGTLTAHIPTGDSSRAFGGGLGFVKSFDPVALFASIHYTRTFSEDFSDIARLEPEDRLDTSMGFALALNEVLSLSGSLSAVFTGATAFPNATLRQQDAYSLGFGLTSRVSRGVYLEPAVSLGLGQPADGFAFGISVFTLRP